MTALLLAMMSLPPAQPAPQPPVAGRPPDFSGLVGGPFVATQHAEPTTLIAEEPLTLTLRLAVAPGGAAGNLRDLSRPALAKLEAYQPFAVEDVDDRWHEDGTPRREFRYRLRPRSAAVTEVPRFKLVYFNPRQPRRYQTTYADALPLTVTPRAPTLPPVATEDVPTWMLEPASEEEIFGPGRGLVQGWIEDGLDLIGIHIDLRGKGSSGWAVPLMAVVLPPAVCLVWLWLWRRANPDAARVALARRSRAAGVALRALAAATSDPPRQVAVALLDYLRDRTGLPPSAVTPAEVEANLAGKSGPLQATVELLRKCDEARFAPTVNDPAGLTAAAERLVLDWEAVS